MDVDGVFAELENRDVIDPTYYSPTADRPWPSSPRDRVLWLATSKARPWLPLAWEQDEPFLARFRRNWQTRSRAGKRVEVGDYWPDLVA